MKLKLTDLPILRGSEMTAILCRSTFGTTLVDYSSRAGGLMPLGKDVITGGVPER